MADDNFDQYQEEFYGKPVDKEPQPKPEKKTRRILVKEGGKLVSKVVSEDELKELNTPKFSKPGKADPSKEIKCSHFGTDIRNKVFGNK